MLSNPSCQVTFQDNNIGTNNKLWARLNIIIMKNYADQIIVLNTSLTDNHCYFFIIIYSNYFRAKNPYVNVQLFL